ncbi:MAG: histidine--tRNA ligase [Deltaproteobacteria bacterium]|nr:histidine--tRNA ligase [Deltaproteobacteria bacterium]
MMQLIRGFRDILPGESAHWQAIEEAARRLFADFGFQEIRIPLLEKTALFARSIGEDTDIVEKEMYTFEDRKGDLITLRPEATASVVRAYIQHKLYAGDPFHKLFTIGPMFRRERPQKGRYRQFYQINAEVFGTDSPLIDAQLVYILMTLLGRLGVSGVQAHVNSLGCPVCRPDFKAALMVFALGRSAALCADCLRRKEKNPLRLLDCKVPSCREAMAQAPEMGTYLCPDCREHFQRFLSALSRLNVPHVPDSRLVRGLDYYTRSTFEIQTHVPGAQNAIAGGGRYDGLVKALGGPDIPATGFAIGLDRLAEIVKKDSQSAPGRPDVFIAALGGKSREKAFEWACRLGEKGIFAEMDFGDRGLKAQMKRAGKLDARYVIIIGESELSTETAVLRDMAAARQEDVPFSLLLGTVIERIGNPH